MKAKGAMNYAALLAFQRDNGRQLYFNGDATDPLLHKFIAENPNNSWGGKFLNSDRAKRKARNGVQKGNEIAAYQNQVAPGSASTQIKIKSPTQAESVQAGMEASNPRKRLSDEDRIKYGDKDMRSFLAEEKLRIADGLSGGGYSRDELVDMLNADGVQTSENVLNAYNSDERMQSVVELGNENRFARPEYETESFIGEGQFGRVSELAPGYVIKEQAPLVEWGGYQEDSSRGNLIGRIHDHRDVRAEADQLNQLNKKHIAPKVENLIVNDDGSTEMIMRDLRDNYITGEDYVAGLNNAYEATASPEKKASLMKERKLFEVKRRQQEAVAGMEGIELKDRHLNNVMAHKMNNRPLQIDPSGVPVEGFDKQALIADRTLQGFRDAGLEEEADIFVGLINETIDKGDEGALKDLVQQGASRLMKINQVPAGVVPSAAELIDSARGSRMAGVRF
jgi:hypothetical protein